MSIGASRSPRLTIVIPTVNRASLVGRAIDSAFAQTYSDFEIIVSNNGSPPSSARAGSSEAEPASAARKAKTADPGAAQRRD